MEQKYIEVNSLPLAYVERSPEIDNTVFFIHGNSGSCRTWRKQFNSELFNNYRLIAFDLPGCGQSFIGNLKWDYSPVATGKLIAEAVKELSGNKPYILIGFSYGTNVIGEMLNYELYPVGVVLAAPCIIGYGYGLDKVFAVSDSIFFHDKVDKDDVENFFSGILKSSEEDIRINTEDFFLARPPFRSALIQSVAEGKVSDEIAGLKKQNIPIQLFFGKEDSMLQINYLENAPFTIWRNTIYKLPGADHYLQNDQPEFFNQLLTEYFEERFTTSHV